MTRQPVLFDRRDRRAAVAQSLNRALTSPAFDHLGAVFAGAVMLWAIVVLLT